MPLFHPNLLEWIISFLVITHLIILMVTIYFHRAAAHKSIILGKKTEAVFRFMSWFFIGMNPREFAAVHRKHHAFTDLKEDPHSPVFYGRMGVLLHGLKLYRIEASNPETIEKYGKGFADNRAERFYEKNNWLGLILFATSLVVLMGLPGLLLWGFALIWIPFWAAGVVNGLGHAFGYRRFATEDMSTNLSPIGIWIGGEELHNNHHARPASPKFSSAWYEFDLGWSYIQLMIFLGMAKLRVPLIEDKKHYVKLTDTLENAISSITVKTLLGDRYHFLRTLERACHREMKVLNKKYQQIKSEGNTNIHIKKEALVQAKMKLMAIWKERMSVENATLVLKQIVSEAREYNFSQIQNWSKTLILARAS